MGDFALETVAHGLGPLALRLLTLPFRILADLLS